MKLTPKTELLVLTALCALGGIVFVLLSKVLVLFAERYL